MKSRMSSAGVLLLGFAFVSGLQAQQLPPLLEPVEALVDADELPPGILVRSRLVTVDLRQLQADTHRLRIPLFDGESMNVEIDRQETLHTSSQQEGSVWSGRVEGQPESFITLVLVQDVLVANLRAQNGRFFQIRHAARNIHVLREIDSSKLPPEGDPLAPTMSPGDREPCSTDRPTRIDVLVLYTDDARTAARSTAAMEASIFLAIDETNLSYRNSHVDQRLRLVHMREVPYDEYVLNLEKHLEPLRGRRDGILDDVHTLRDTYRADVSVLILEKANLCGLSYIMDKVSTGFEDHAFAVVTRTCATAKYSFGHELGHIMSARHEWGKDDKKDQPFPDNHGKISFEGGWRTMMGIDRTLERIPFWSNPDIIFRGRSLGICSGPQQANNHRVLNATAPTVANFRCSSSGASEPPPP